MEKIDEIIDLIDSKEKKETKNFFIKYIRNWYWFVIFLVIGAGIGYFIYSNLPSKYLVTSRLLVEDENASLSSALDFEDRQIRRNNDNTNIENKVSIFKSYSLFKRALNNLGWETSWYRKELFHNVDLYKNQPFELTVPPNAMNAKNVPIEIKVQNENEYKISAKGETNQNGYNQSFDFEETVRFGEPFINDYFNFQLDEVTGNPDETYFLVFNNINQLTNQYLKRTEIALEDINADIITIEIETSAIQREVDFINELNDVFIEFGLQNRIQVSEKSFQFIDEQLNRIKESLTVAEQNFSDYRRSNQVMNLGEEAQSVYQRLEEIENEQYMTQLQIDYYRQLLNNLNDADKVNDIASPGMVGIDDANLSDLLARLIDLYSRREVLSATVQEKNPAYVNIQNEIRVTRNALEEAVKNQLGSAESVMASSRSRYQTIENRLRRLPETEKELIERQRDFDLNNELYTYLQEKKAEASIAKSSIVPEVQVIDEAIREAAIHNGPFMIQIVGAGAFVGLLIPFMFISLVSFFNNKIETREEVEKAIQIPVLEGIIKHKYKVNLPVINYPRSGIAESFRGIKSNVNALVDQPGCKVISINSMVPEEGKSFISSNFAAILTKSNKKVLIIDADMHKPNLHKFFGVKSSVGLSNYLNGEVSYEEIIYSTSINNLFLIQAGPIPTSPSDLLDTPRLDYLVEKNRKEFDYIIIDNAPLLLVPDAILTSQTSDISLFTLRMNHSHKDEIKQINRLINFNNIKRAAVIINETPDRGYGYGNKYWKKGYGEYKYKMNIA
ncbi:MAG: GumC family protein [Bacteroidota bacterium]